VWIAVDIDNTVANTNLELVRRFGISLKKYPAPEVPPGFFASREGMQMLQKVEPFPHAARALEVLADLGYRIAYISSRPGDALFATVRWLQVNGFPADQVVTGLVGDAKLDVIRELEPTAVFEDDPIAVKMLVGRVPAVWLKDWPYNRPGGRDGIQRPGSNVIRFKSWEEVFRAVISSNPELAAAELTARKDE
jgi:hypothetical protein